MANSIERYMGANPNGNTDVMSKVTVTAAGYLDLAVIPAQDSYTLRLWIKANGTKNVIAYIGTTAFAMSVTSTWKEFICTATANANNSSELYLPTGIYYIWHAKLECSTKPSDYTQSPEDVDEKIQTAADNAVSEANAYTEGTLTEALRAYTTTEQLYSEINQTKTEIGLSVKSSITETKTYAAGQAANALTSANQATDVKLRNYVTTTKHTSDLTLLDNRITAAVTATNTLATYVDGDFYDQVTQEYSTLVTQTANGIESRASQTYATITTVNGIATRVTTAESNITQNAESISTTVSRLATDETRITQNSNSITSLSTTVSGHTSQITQNANSISSLTTTVNGHTTQITQNANSITSLSSTVSGHTTQITQNANSITALSRTVDGHTSQITQNANAISAAVTTMEEDYYTKSAADTQINNAKNSATTTATNNAKTYTDNQLSGYYTKTATDSRITVAQNSILETVSNAVSKYDETGKNITLRGYGSPATRYPAASYNNKNYLDQNNGDVYHSNGSSWSKTGTCSLITDVMQSQITINANGISSLSSSVTTQGQRITQNSNDITLINNKFNDYSTTTETQSLITQNNTTIETTVRTSVLSTVADTYPTKTQVQNTYATQTTVNGLATRMTTAESQITQNANNISLCVKEGNLISTINQSAELLSISSNRISILSTNFTLSTTGNIYAKSARLENAEITGLFKTTDTSKNFMTEIYSGTIKFYSNNLWLAQFTPVGTSNITQLGIVSNNANYSGIALGEIKNGSVDTYYRCYMGTAASAASSYYDKCIHEFRGDVKFISSTGKFLDHINFKRDYGLSWDGTIGLRYYVSGGGLILGMSGVTTYLGGYAIRCQAKLYTVGGIEVTSDARKKHDITALDTRYLGLFDRLDGKMFKYNDIERNRNQIGFIAQDVLAALTDLGINPQEIGLVDDVNGDGSEYTLNYMALIPVMWEEIKKLRRNSQ